MSRPTFDGADQESQVVGDEEKINSRYSSEGKEGGTGIKSPMFKSYTSFEALPLNWLCLAWLSWT